ncbi:hypothetical protein CTA1_5391 [Colletotrichum tanaceti]|uniref:Uncharacterized protein n=1 Tax=Colletotrichum tanaceti TaxID=1306861 RepID=A0A4U6XN35_9PEZI|nr:hypothetical protein CTA1_5391 [Colletotrichum tanaceti]
MRDSTQKQSSNSKKTTASHRAIPVSRPQIQLALTDRIRQRPHNEAGDNSLDMLRVTARAVGAGGGG